ncbi:MAG: hypothetical protein ACRDJO_01140 [Actinomycetota bacterium]
MSTREIVVRRSAGAGLNARIAVVSALVVAQFWALASTLDAWLAGHQASVPGLVAFQAACAGLSFGVRRLGRATR